MNMKAILAAAVAMSAFGLSSVWAEDLLDQGLSGEASKPAVAEPKPAAKPVKPPVKQDVINPEAVKNVDNQDLENDLIQTEKKAGDKFKEIVERMGQSKERLTKEQDAGAETQEIQRRIVMDLDVLIELAKKMQQQQSQSQSQSQGQQQGQKREQSQGQQQGQGQGPHNPQGQNAAQQSQAPGGGQSAAQSNGQDIKERTREWGTLPERDRDLVSNGAQEQFLPAYREAIDKYYQALAELGKAARER